MSTGEWSGYPNDAALRAPQDSGTDKRYLGGVRRGPTAPQDEAVEVAKRKAIKARDDLYLVCGRTYAADGSGRRYGCEAHRIAAEEAIEAYGDAREAKGRREALEEQLRNDLVGLCGICLEIVHPGQRCREDFQPND